MRPGSLDELPVVKEGIWLYAESAPVRVRLLSSPETWGSGDHEDEESVAENQSISCYFVAYESAGSPGNFNNIVPNIMSLEEAVSLVERKFPGIEWT